MVPHPQGADHTLLVIISLIASVAGLAIAFFFYGTGSQGDRLQKVAPPIFAISRSRFYFDEIYNAYVSKVQQRLADITAFFDTLFIGGLCVRGLAGVAGLGGMVARSLQTGSLHAYVWWFFIGLVLFWAFGAGLFLTF
jgi:NADH-quinone oxidoreductase subunit L